MRMTRQDHVSPVGSDPSRRQTGSTKGTTGALYTPEERRRRDESNWTLVQGILAPLQFLVFLASLALVVRTLTTGEGAFAADVSIVVKTLVLYTIMITGSIWEKVVFGRWLFAPAFFWEDVFSMLVLALHTLYLVMLLGVINMFGIENAAAACRECGRALTLHALRFGPTADRPRPCSRSNDR